MIEWTHTEEDSRRRRKRGRGPGVVHHQHIADDLHTPGRGGHCRVTN